MAQPPQACAPCPAHYAVLQGAYARYTNTLIVLERALYLAHARDRTSVAGEKQRICAKMLVRGSERAVIQPF